MATLNFPTKPVALEAACPNEMTNAAPPKKCYKNIAPLGFDPRTFGLWAQHASSAPRSSTFDDFAEKLNATYHKCFYYQTQQKAPISFKLIQWQTLNHIHHYSPTFRTYYWITRYQHIQSTSTLT